MLVDEANAYQHTRRSGSYRFRSPCDFILSWIRLAKSCGFVSIRTCVVCLHHCDDNQPFHLVLRWHKLGVSRSNKTAFVVRGWDIR